MSKEDKRVTIHHIADQMNYTINDKHYNIVSSAFLNIAERIIGVRATRINTLKESISQPDVRYYSTITSADGATALLYQVNRGKRKNVVLFRSNGKVVGAPEGIDERQRLFAKHLEQTLQSKSVILTTAVNRTITPRGDGIVFAGVQNKAGNQHLLVFKVSGANTDETLHADYLGTIEAVQREPIFDYNDSSLTETLDVNDNSSAFNYYSKRALAEAGVTGVVKVIPEDGLKGRGWGETRQMQYGMLVVTPEQRLFFVHRIIADPHADEVHVRENKIIAETKERGWLRDGHSELILAIKSQNPQNEKRNTTS